MAATTKHAVTSDLDHFLEWLGRRKMTKALAREVLKLGFTEAEHERAHELAAKNTDGVISPGELQELDAIIGVGMALSTLHSRARVALRARSGASRGHG